MNAGCYYWLIRGISLNKSNTGEKKTLPPQLSENDLISAMCHKIIIITKPINFADGKLAMLLTKLRNPGSE